MRQEIFIFEKPFVKETEITFKPVKLFVNTFVFSGLYNTILKQIEEHYQIKNLNHFSIEVDKSKIITPQNLREIFGKNVRTYIRAKIQDNTLKIFAEFQKTKYSRVGLVIITEDENILQARRLVLKIEFQIETQQVSNKNPFIQMIERMSSKVKPYIDKKALADIKCPLKW
jgi:hypothetical protein